MKRINRFLEFMSPPCWYIFVQKIHVLFVKLQDLDRSILLRKLPDTDTNRFGISGKGNVEWATAKFGQGSFKVVDNLMRERIRDFEIGLHIHYINPPQLNC